MPECHYCNLRPAVLKRPKTSEKICKECFFSQFELEIHNTIIKEKLFSPHERIAIAASGGKDSTVLAYVLTKLNKEYKYDLNLFLLSIDEGIQGYRDDSLESVNRNQKEYNIPLLIISYKELYGWSMDEIVAHIGLKNNCTFCGVFRRQALDRGAVLLKADKIVTGHNCDDMAETVLMNLLRGDIARLQRCTAITTGGGNNPSANLNSSNPSVITSLPRCKPFKYAYEKEIVMYAYYKQLDYFSTECIYSPNAYRGFARELLKEMEKIKSKSIIDIVKSGEKFKLKGFDPKNAASVDDGDEDEAASHSSHRITAATAAAAASSSSSSNTVVASRPSSRASNSSTGSNNRGAPVIIRTLGLCERCGYMSSNKICKACVMLEGLNKGRAKITLQTESNTILPIASHAIGTFTASSNGIPMGAMYNTDDATTSSDSSASTILPVPKKIGSGLSAPMDMAQKMNATNW